MERRLALKDLTLCALMAAISVIFSFLASIVSLAAFFLAIVLPFASVYVTINIKNRYYILYALATFLLSLLVAYNSFEVAIFYVFPSLVIGFIIGYFLKSGTSFMFILFLSTYLQLGLLYFSILLIDFIFQIDFILTLFTLFNLKSVYLSNPFLGLILLYLLSLAQMFITNFIILNETKRFNFVSPWTFKKKFAYLLSFSITLFALILWILFPKTILILHYLLVPGSLLMMVFAWLEIIFDKQYPVLSFFLVGMGISFFLIALLYEKNSSHNFILSGYLLALPSLFILAVRTYLFNQKKDSKINAG